MLHLGDILREGGPTGFVREFNREFFDHLDRNPAFGEAFNDHMTSMSTQDTDVILEALASYDFSAVSHVCDVGGGHGHLLCTLLASHPHLDGTVLERPSVIADEDRLWAWKLGVAERCTYMAGDMFEQVPAADLYLLKFILHDWDDEKCVRILTNLHEAAPHDGRLFAVEGVVPGPGIPHFAKRLDLAMLVHVGGRERTESEYSSLLERAGWTLEATWVPDDGPLSVLEARAA